MQWRIGYSADYFGRKAVCEFNSNNTHHMRIYSLGRTDGKELMLIIFATIGTICNPTGASAIF